MTSSDLNHNYHPVIVHPKKKVPEVNEAILMSFDSHDVQGILFTFECFLNFLLLGLFCARKLRY